MLYYILLYAIPTGYHSYCLSPKLKRLPSSGDDWYGPCCRPRPILATCWLPLQNVDYDSGPLAILPGTSDLPNTNRSVSLLLLLLLLLYTYYECILTL